MKKTKIEIETHLNFNASGFNIEQYYDVNGIQSNEPVNTSISYETLKENYFEGITVKNKEKEYIQPNSNDLPYIEEEIAALEHFTSSLKTRLNELKSNYYEMLDN